MQMGFLLGKLGLKSHSHHKSSESLSERDLEDSDLFVVRYKPERLDALCRDTNFTRDEIRVLYQGFKQECPTGRVDEDSFKNIFAQFFPQGDATQYAHYVFNTLKPVQTNGTLNFEQFLGLLSSLSRGTAAEKVKWVFGLYDINGDGYISKQEMLSIVSAIYDMLGSYTDPIVHGNSAKEHVDNLFAQIDSNKDGLLSFEEFLEWCSKDENRSKSLFMLDTIL